MRIVGSFVHSLAVGSALLTAAAVMAGCGPDCRSSCTKLYGNSTQADGSTQCQIVVPGKSGDEGRNELIADCEATCDAAMRNTGEMNGYDPNQKGTGDDISINNEKQAAAWMDCVAETSCDNLGKGFCEPHR